MYLFMMGGKILRFRDFMDHQMLTVPVPLRSLKREKGECHVVIGQRLHFPEGNTNYKHSRRQLHLPPHTHTNTFTFPGVVIRDTCSQSQTHSQTPFTLCLFILVLILFISSTLYIRLPCFGQFAWSIELIPFAGYFGSSYFLLNHRTCTCFRLRLHYVTARGRILLLHTAL